MSACSVTAFVDIIEAGAADAVNGTIGRAKRGHRERNSSGICRSTPRESCCKSL